MATIRQFSLFDMLHYNNINLDILTQTFNSYFYAKYLIKWPEYCVSLWSSTHSIQAYLMGKVEGEVQKKEWHGHVTAVTVAPQCRKQGFARLLMNFLERVSENHKGFFVDLFVRASNNVAIDMYKKLGYDIYRTVNKYYSSSIDQSGQDAYENHYHEISTNKHLNPLEREQSLTNYSGIDQYKADKLLERNFLSQSYNLILQIENSMGQCVGKSNKEDIYIAKPTSTKHLKELDKTHINMEGDRNSNHPLPIYETEKQSEPINNDNDFEQTVEMKRKPIENDEKKNTINMKSVLPSTRKQDQQVFQARIMQIMKQDPIMANIYMRVKQKMRKG